MRRACTPRHRAGVAMLAVALVTGSSTAAESPADSDSWGTVRELYYGEALFQFYQQRYFTSLVHLGAAREQGRIRAHELDSDMLQAGLHVSYAMPRHADRELRRLAQAASHPAGVRDRAWFYLGKLNARRGAWATAQEALDQIQAPLPEPLNHDRQLIEANLAMSQDEYQRAADHLEPPPSSEPWTTYAQLNRAVALLNAEEHDQARTILSKLGARSVDGQELWTLRDRANLMLGRQLLQQQRPQAAVATLSRVRRDGPEATAALLAIGWAHAAQDEHQRALTAWRQLAGTSQREGLQAALAIPLALARLKLYSASLEGYQHATQAYRAELEELEGTMAAIRSGALHQWIATQARDGKLGWLWDLERLEQAPAATHLHRLLASNRFQEAGTAYQDLLSIRSNLDHWQRQIAVFRGIVETRRQGFAQRRQIHRDGELAETGSRLRRQRDALAARLEQVGEQRDVWALATGKERRMIEALQRVEVGLRALPPDTDRGPLRERYRRLRGALLWRLSTEFEARLWERRKSLRELDREIAQYTHRRAGLNGVLRRVPETFRGFDSRIDQLEQRLRQARSRLVPVIQAQRQRLERMLLDALQQRRALVNEHLAQAQFAVAQIHDRALHAESEPSP